MVVLLTAAALVVGIPAPTPSSPPAAPAMFVVRDQDTTVYIFGTFHALDGDTNWFGRGVREAFEGSDELVLETLLPDGGAPAAIGRPGLPVRPPSVTPSASFLATTKMAIDAGQARGMRVDNGADMVLRHVAEAEGKPVQALETLEFQLNMFNSMPPAASGGPKAGTPVGEPPMQSLSNALAEMLSAWKRGDQHVFVRILGQFEGGSPATYRMMFTERNTRWADWIRARMQAPGTVFVAVGAGHLAGKDSVLVRLAERGLPSRRVY